MDPASSLVAAGFGLLVGWGLGRYERRPTLVALAIGLAAGGLMLAFGYEPVEAGRWLVLGCAAALTVLVLRRANDR